jgi:hypothetical protein
LGVSLALSGEFVGDRRQPLVVNRFAGSFFTNREVAFGFERLMVR